nr:glycosyltransferase family 2 protein [Candidatus Levybacteria bacterium]
MVLSIIILNYKTKDLTTACINSIVEQYKKELDDNKFEIIVIDNNSQDESFETLSGLQSAISNLKIIESKENLGFAKGCNLAASKARGENLLFLNSDTEIKDQGFLKMVNFISQNKNIGILGGKLKNLDGTSQLSSGKFYSLFNLFLVLLGFNELFGLRQSPNVIKKVDWVSGGCFMIRKDVFQKVKGFEKDFFMYIEDMELCFRVKKKGYLTYFYPEIMLFHKELGSSNRTFAIVNIYKGILLFYKKHKSNPEYLLAKLMLKSKALILVVLGKISNNKYLKDTYLEALKI